MKTGGLAIVSKQMLSEQANSYKFKESDSVPSETMWKSAPSNGKQAQDHGNKQKRSQAERAVLLMHSLTVIATGYGAELEADVVE